MRLSTPTHTTHPLIMSLNQFAQVANMLDLPLNEVLDIMNISVDDAMVTDMSIEEIILDLEDCGLDLDSSNSYYAHAN